MRFEDLSDYLTLRQLTLNPWQVMRFRKLQRDGDELEVQMIDDGPFWLRGGRNDHHMFHRIFLRDEYELASLANADVDCVVDLGANVGLFSVRASQLARRVIAYEPAKSNYAQLSKNAAHRANVDAVHAAVSGKEGTLRLYQPRWEALSGVHSSFPEMGGHMSEEFEDVRAITLDQLFETHAVDRCDLLKIDVEGQEYDILHAASERTLARIRRIHGEYHDVQRQDPKTRISAFSSFLESRGFELTLRPHRKKTNHGLFFAARPESPNP